MAYTFTHCLSVYDKPVLLCASYQGAEILFVSTLHLMPARLGSLIYGRARNNEAQYFGGVSGPRSNKEMSQEIRDKWVDDDKQGVLRNERNGQSQRTGRNKRVDAENLWSIAGFTINKHIH